MTMTTSTPDADEIIKMNWKVLAIGSRETLKERLEAVDNLLSLLTPIVSSEEQRLAVLPISEDTADRRSTFLVNKHRVELARRAKRTLERELSRRGETVVENP